MYKLTPKEKLTEGYYALHFGGLENISTIEASVGNTAFDFVIGNSDDYQSSDLVNAHPKDAIFLDMRKYMMKKNCKKLQSKGQIHAFSLFPMSNY